MTGVPALYTKHLKTPQIIATEFRIPGMAPDDTEQEARIALWLACRSYNPERGKFPAYASMVIRARLTDLLRAATRDKRTAELVYPKDIPAPDQSEGREHLQLVLDAVPTLTKRERQAVADHLNGQPSKESKSHDSALDRARAKLRNAA